MNKFYLDFIAILFELGKIYAFLKIALEAQINVHFVRYIFRRRENLFQDFWSPFSISFYFSSECNYLKKMEPTYGLCLTRTPGPLGYI